MEVRQAALKSLIKVIEHNKSYDDTLEFYAGKVDKPSDLVNTLAGTIKFKLTLDFFIEQLSSRKLKKMSPIVRNILRLGVFELEYLKRPEYAVVNSYVDLCRKLEKNSANFVNAILRNFIRKKSDFLQKKDENLITRYSHPEWLISRWIKNYGVENTVKILEFNNKPPKTCLRVNRLKANKDKLMGIIKAKASQLCEDCLVLEEGGNIKQLPGYEEGLWVVQGESSAMVAPVLDPQEGEKILDLCAAPGSKTTHIAALMGNKGKITAVDISTKRLERIKENCKRLGISCVEMISADASEFGSKEQFDRILVDSPCSNTGVLGKRPDARWKRKPEDIISTAELQLKILNNAAKMLKEGGVLVYSTCSIEPEENTGVIDAFLKNNKGFKLESSKLILQSECDTDGFFISKMIKSS